MIERPVDSLGIEAPLLDQFEVPLDAEQHDVVEQLEVLTEVKRAVPDRVFEGWVVAPGQGFGVAHEGPRAAVHTGVIAVGIGNQVDEVDLERQPLFVGPALQDGGAGAVRQGPAQHFTVETGCGTIEIATAEEAARELRGANHRAALVTAQDVGPGGFHRHHAAGAKAVEARDLGRRQGKLAVNHGGEAGCQEVALRARRGQELDLAGRDLAAGQGIPRRLGRHFGIREARRAVAVQRVVALPDAVLFQRLALDPTLPAIERAEVGFHGLVADRFAGQELPDGGDVGAWLRHWTLPCCPFELSGNQVTIRPSRRPSSARPGS